MKKESIKVIGRAKQPKQEKSTLIKNQKPLATHSQTCKAITDYMRSKHPDKLFIHIPNEGKRSLAQGKKLKDEGLLAGTYDYLLCHVSMKYDAGALISVIPGLWIEVKAKKDKLSKTQKAFRERAIAAHYSVLEVYSVDEFMAAVEEYLK